MVAGFSPCGAIVGVVRSCYQRSCRWYQGGPAGVIRYYFVPETNKLLKGLNRFFPYSQFEPEIVNLDDTGEITSARKFYSKGNNPNPVNTGRAPCGSATDFAGESFAPSLPIAQCECDNGPGFNIWVALRASVRWGSGNQGALFARITLVGSLTEIWHGQGGLGLGGLAAWHQSWGLGLGQLGFVGLAAWHSSWVSLGGLALSGDSPTTVWIGGPAGLVFNDQATRGPRWIGRGGMVANHGALWLASFVSEGGLAVDGSAEFARDAMPSGGLVWGGSAAFLPVLLADPGGVVFGGDVTFVTKPKP